jgi:hypothetical protein
LPQCCKVMHNAAMKTPPTPTRIRVTVPVTPEVQAAFQRIGEAIGTSTGRAMADWLGDTLDAAQYMATTLEKARAAPRVVAQELHAYALGMADETGALMSKLREKGAAAGARVAGASGGPSSPPSCNTGGKVPPGKPIPKGGKAR